jgi:hypothetical protein
MVRTPPFLIFLLFALFASSGEAKMEDACARFWSDMQRNRERIEVLHMQSVASREPSQELLNMIAEPLSVCDPQIVFEFGTSEGGEFELTISADGVREKIDRVLELVKAAPRIKGWKVYAFRQPTQLRLSMHGQTVDSSTVMFAAERVGQQLDTSKNRGLEGSNLIHFQGLCGDESDVGSAGLV